MASQPRFLSGLGSHGSSGREKRQRAEMAGKHLRTSRWESGLQRTLPQSKLRVLPQWNTAYNWLKQRSSSRRMPRTRPRQHFLSGLQAISRLGPRRRFCVHRCAAFVSQSSPKLGTASWPEEAVRTTRQQATRQAAASACHDAFSSTAGLLYSHKASCPSSVMWNALV